MKINEVKYIIIRYDSIKATEIWEIMSHYRCKLIHYKSASSANRHTNDYYTTWRKYQLNSPVDKMVKKGQFATKAQVFAEML